VGLKPGWRDAGTAARNVELVGSVIRPTEFAHPDSIGTLMVGNTDIAFKGNRLYLGNFSGFSIYDIANPRQPKLLLAHVCPGGQGDMSVYGNLLFMSVEMPNGRVDCGSQGNGTDSVSTTRIGGVRIFDITDELRPKQVAAVQTCRGSHTHTLVTDPKDDANVYIYVSGSGTVRSPSELPGCSGGPPDQDPNTALFRIEVIKVPLAAPHTATVVNSPRIFANPQTGAIAGLWQGGKHGEGTQETSVTNQCHDITAYPEIGLAGGACSGNGILLDISKPAQPVRVAEVIDPNFAYWHSATFNNDGSKILFTDEWGGGSAARCMASDPMTWGADALFEIGRDRKLELKSYYKMPAPQTSTENCVAHNGSMIPIPGRDVMVQAWYQGGMSIFDWTNAAKPIEIAFYDRGAYSPTDIHIGGFWGTYWYNGRVYASEIGRGLDVFELKPSEFLTQNEIDAAKTVTLASFNPQTQVRFVWPASFVLARAYLDQLRRTDADATRLSSIAGDLARAEQLTGAERRTVLNRINAGIVMLRSEARAASLLAQTVKDLAAQ
jgi:hypothetical protein